MTPLTITRAASLQTDNAKLAHLYVMGPDADVYKHKQGPFPKDVADRMAPKIEAAKTVNADLWECLPRSWVETGFARAALTQWRPEQEPFRISGTMPSNQPGLHGWTYIPSKTFATREEAMAYGQEYKDKHPGHKVVMDEAKHPEAWQARGHWQRLWSFKRTPKGAPADVIE